MRVGGAFLEKEGGNTYELYKMRRKVVAKEKNLW